MQGQNAGVSTSDLRNRLLAILAADAVGYSRLMSLDERATVAALDSARAIFREHVAAHGGRVIDMAGDSVLAVFKTATGAVATALAVQRQLASSSADVPDDHRMRFRIGVHMGDLIEKSDGTVYGDGVNIAARLQALAEPGGISVSDAIHGAVRGKVPAGFEDKGEQHVKNIAHAIRAWRVSAEGTHPAQQPTPGTRSSDSTATFGAGRDGPSIAVLPFANMSGDPEQDYFTDGVVEDIITALSRFKSLFVIARNSSFVYKGKAVDVRTVGRELGVRYVLEGSVRKAGNRIRVTCQLIASENGAHLWADRYDRDLVDLFEMQDDITRRVATAVDPAIRGFETQAALRKHPGNLGAWDHVLRGMWHVYQYKKNENAKGRAEFESALARDPGYAPAHAWLAATHLNDAWFNWTDQHARSLSLAQASASNAIRLDDTEPQALAIAASVDFFSSRIDQAREKFGRALELNPNSFNATYGYGGALNYSGECDAAEQFTQKALELSPNDPLVWNCLGSLAHIYLNLRRYDDAVATADRAIARRHGYVFARAVKTAALAHAGRVTQAAEALSAIRQIDAGFSLSHLSHYPFVLSEQRYHLYSGLAAAGLADPDATSAAR
jgi:adenylate cyclase